MTETITIRGFVGNDVRTITTERGLPISTFRLASTPRRFDREKAEWVDGETNWYSVTCFRALAQNVRTTLSTGDPVLVTGRLKIRQWTNDAGQRGTSVEIDADGVGHDLTFGTGSFTRLSGGGAPASGGQGADVRGGELHKDDSPDDGAVEGADPGSAWDAEPSEAKVGSEATAPF